MVAAEAGAYCISPFIGRLDDKLRKELHLDPKTDNPYFNKHGRRIKNSNDPSVEPRLVEEEGVVSGVDLAEKIVKMYHAQGYKTNVLAASIRHKRQVVESAEAGAQMCTMPYRIFQELTNHELTKVGMERFEIDCPQAYRDLFKLE